MKKHVLFCIIVFLLAAVNTISLGENYPLNASGTANLPLNVNPAGKTEGYSAIVYNNPNGLPTSEANAIAETSEGFIWIGSYAGLIRYDGNTFERFDSTTGIASVRCLYADSLDRLVARGAFRAEDDDGGGTLENIDNIHKAQDAAERDRPAPGGPAASSSGENKE